MAASKIRKASGIQNGAACIGRTQIPVWKLIQFRSLGGSDADLLSDYPELSREDLKAARNYYAQNGEEIDQAIAHDAEQ